MLNCRESCVNPLQIGAPFTGVDFDAVLNSCQSPSGRDTFHLSQTLSVAQQVSPRFLVSIPFRSGRLSQLCIAMPAGTGVLVSIPFRSGRLSQGDHGTDQRPASARVNPLQIGAPFTERTRYRGELAIHACQSPLDRGAFHRRERSTTDGEGQVSIPFRSGHLSQLGPGRRNRQRALVSIPARSRHPLQSRKPSASRS